MNSSASAETEVYVSIGSNIRPVENLQLAHDALAAAYGKLKVSCVYRSDAIGFEGDDFLNAVIGFRTSDEPQQVLEQIEAMHASANRVRTDNPFSPRTLDVDLLLYGGLVNRALKIPHPDIDRYAFVVGPLAELAPDLAHPVSGKSMAELWGAFDAGNGQMNKVDIDLN